MAATVLAGCHKDSTVKQLPKPPRIPKLKEEIVDVPDEPRYNLPPSAETSGRAKVTEEKESLFGKSRNKP
ncbi:MAG TPA: hypothetical protein VGI99_05045 [Gemmataceae bacterium]